MPGAVKETNIEEIAGMLVEHRSQGKHPILFLGARAGGVFRNAYLYETLKQFSLLNFDKLSSAEQFRECYRVLTSKYFDETTRHEILVNALGPLTYRHEDRLLSGLVKAGFFKAIITTNIDMLLEDAFSSWGMRESGDYRVYKPGVSDIGDLTHEKMEERYIVKVFGDLNSWSYRVGSSSTGLDEGLTRFLDSKLSEDVVVIGYDPVWDRTVERTFPLAGEALWYINETSLEQNTYLANVLKLRGGKYLQRKLGNYSDFLRALYVFLGEEVSREKAESIPPLALAKGIFISCSHEDSQHLERLKIHLKGYLLSESEKSIQDILQIWDDTKLLPGKDWSEEIKEALAQAKVAILLVSNQLLSSISIRKQELPIVLEAAQRGDLKLFSVILDSSSKAFDENRVPLYQYTVVNGASEPLDRKGPYDQEVLWARLARQVFTVLGA